MYTAMLQNKAHVGKFLSGIAWPQGKVVAGMSLL
jgi:hypothetical protein